MSITQDKSDKLNKEFKKATENVKKLKKIPSSDELLQLYGLYKQANFGKNTTGKPSIFYFKALQKWLAWTIVSDLTKDQAKQEYINLVNYLLEPETK